MLIIADDFGLDRENDLIINDLIQKSFVDATSAMLIFEDNQVYPKGKVGLHITLCLSGGLKIRTITNQDMTYPSYKKLVSRLFLFPQKKFIYDEIISQYELFLKRFGKKPLFIDFHMNLQHFPQIYSIFMDICARNPEISMIPLRIHHKIKPFDNLKNSLFNIMGFFCVKLLKRPKKLLNAHITSNPKILNRLPKKNLVFYCHPGTDSNKIKEKDDYSLRSHELEIIKGLRLPS